MAESISQKICPHCGRKKYEINDFSNAEIVIFERYEEWKKVKKNG